MMEKEPTSLMYAAEGVENLDWEKLLKQRTPENGSFLSSPAATAVAFMHTKDEDCLRYIKYLLEKFNGGGTFKFIIISPTIPFTVGNFFEGQ